MHLRIGILSRNSKEFTMKSEKLKSLEPKSLIQHVEIIAVKAKVSGFTPKYIKSVIPNARAIAPFLGCNEIQSIIFSILFNLNFKSARISIDDLAEYMNCSPISILSYQKDFDQLVKLKVIRRYYNDDGRPISRRDTCLDRIRYYVNKYVLDSLSQEKIFIPRKLDNLDVYGLLDALDCLFTERDNELLTFEEMSEEINTLLEDNSKLDFVKKIKKLELQDDNLFILLCLSHEYTDDNESMELVRIIKAIFPELKKQLSIRKEFIDGKNELIQKDIVNLEDGNYRSDRDIKLTERSVDFLFGNDKKVFTQKKIKKRLDVILSSDIEYKSLYFNSPEKSSLEFLTKSLFPSNFNKLRLKMKQNGLKQGFAALFFGSTGTGKTESVHQIAKKTGRDIKMVVISETKSYWFGQSEKLIKAVFDDYRKMVENSKIAPILLFNEADGIFSSRKQLGHSPVDQTENAIQNIILQEMEDLNGILIATTNLNDNLDKAFERRFLYKIRFEKPSVECKFHIWKDKISTLSDQDVRRLAERFDLSGGQIDNIARKYLMHKILFSKNPDLSELEKSCLEEYLEPRQSKRLGF